MSTFRINLAGFPAQISPPGIFLVTILPAPTIAWFPIVTPHKMVTLEPMEAPFSTIVGKTSQSFSVCSSPPGLIALGYLSFINVTEYVF